MDAYFQNKGDPSRREEDWRSDLDAWFAVSGDMDDFIFFEDSHKPHSER